MGAPLEKIAEIQAKVGQDLEPSPWLLIDQAMVNAFADVVFEADSWTHTDPIRAAPLGGTTVPGMLLLSMIPHLLRPHVGMPEGFTNGFNYGFDRLRFTNVLRVGKRVRVHARLLEFGPHGETGWRRKLKVTVEIEGEARPAMVADWMVLYV